MTRGNAYRIGGLLSYTTHLYGKSSTYYINSRNQVTIPKEMLNMFRAKHGDLVKVRANEKERVVEINNVKIVDLE